MNIDRRIRTLTAIVVLALLVPGCSPDWEIEIESDTEWTVTYGGVSGENWSTSVQRGSGDKTINVSNDDKMCLILMQHGSGSTRVKLKNTNGGPFGIFGPDGREEQTNVSGGSVQMCSEGSIPR
jgi:hypothetical protein